MSWILLRYVVRTYLAALAAVFAAAVTIFLVVDFVDHASVYKGAGWVASVALLYGYKAIIVTHQLGPVALMLAAGIAISGLRQRGEWVGMRSLGVGPLALYLPIALTAGAFCVGLAVLDETVAVTARRRVDQIYESRFSAWGRDFRTYFSRQKWFRRGDWVFYLRNGDVDTGFEDVTLLKLNPEFQLDQRIDARKMSYAGDESWALEGVVDRTLTPDGGSTARTVEHQVYDLGTNERPFRIRLGRPEQMSVRELREQIRARRAGGLATGAFLLALHNRFAYPLGGLPAALLALGIALRPNRRGHLTASLVEGVGISAVLWGLTVVLRTLALAEHLPAGLAAWAPLCLLAAAAGALGYRWERGSAR